MPGAFRPAVFAVVLIAAAATSAAARGDEPKVEWAGKGTRRLLVRVEPAEIDGRERDEMPAEVEIDWPLLLTEIGPVAPPGRVDLASIQVMRYDPATGRPLPYNNYAYAHHDADRPFAWYDASIPYEFPEFEESVDRTNGRIVRKPVLRGGYFYNAIGDRVSGRLAWSHTQDAKQPSWYAVYFSLDRNAEPQAAPPRGWLGDGLPRFDRTGTSSCGADHCRVDLDDWNNDGLIDLVVGEAYGHVFWWPNRGTRTHPSFPYSRFVFDAEGLPIDAGDAAAPKIVDWDGDGAKDLLVGAEWNRILYYRNTGTNAQRKLEYQGLLQADGETLALPVTPVAAASAAIFKRDYYPVLETVDWDGDGDLDLLAGGYVTGRIYFYENTGRGADGAPKLSLRAPLEADGEILNVGDWCAAPCLADFDGDGDLDLMSGNMPIGAARSQQQKDDIRFLRYYENTGDARRPAFRARPFPKEGEFPRAGLATPRAYDWDADGDLDLVASARENLYLFENRGTRTLPRFAAHDTFLPAPWGQSALAVDQFRDWDGDGRLDLVNGYNVRLSSGKGNPGAWERSQNVLPPGEHIAHSSGIGDDWFWPALDDFDDDGRIDVLFGDWHGHVWFHRNLTEKTRRHFDTVGTKLQLESGADIKVGPIGKDLNTDFDALQGARTVFTVADFNRDGLRDLVVGDTYGKIRYFRSVGPRDHPRFAEPIEFGDLGIRLLVTATDWNQDGWIDVIGGAANGRVEVYLNTAGKSDAPFAPGMRPPLPPIAQPRVLVADLNGDGDDDLFFPSTQGSCLVERSFLTHGYARGILVAAERRPER